MRPSALLLMRLVTALATLAWIGAGLAIALDYGTADAGTPRAEAPRLAVYAGYLLPLAGSALFWRALMLAGQRDRIAVRRTTAGGTVCLLVWLAAWLVLSSST
jgi:hypothetical protein